MKIVIEKSEFEKLKNIVFGKIAACALALKIKFRELHSNETDLKIYNYNFFQLQFQPTAYLSNLADINNRINSVELMADLQDAFCLTHETLYLAINIMDRFYSTQGRISTTPKNLTLVVHTAAFIACKFEVS